MTLNVSSLGNDHNGPNEAPNSSRAAILKIVFANIGVSAFAKASGVLSGLVLFLSSIVLLLQPVVANEPVGGHLAQLAILLPGYSVSWLGALIGGAYGSVLGALLGGGIAVLWNLSRVLYLRLILTKARLRALIGDTP